MKFIDFFRDARKYISSEWKISKVEVLIVVSFFLTYIVSTILVSNYVGGQIVYLLPYLLIILFTFIYQKYSSNILTFSLFFATTWSVFASISDFTLENIVYNYMSIPFLILANTFFISGYYLLFKHKKYFAFFYSSILMFFSIFLFDILKNIFLYLWEIFSLMDLTLIYYVVNPPLVFTNNFLTYIVMSLLFGVPLFMHLGWFKNYVGRRPVLACAYMGFLLGLFIIIRNLFGMIVFVRHQFLFDQLLSLEFNVNLFGFNYLLLFALFGLFNLFITKLVLFFRGN